MEKGVFWKALIVIKVKTAELSLKLYTVILSHFSIVFDFEEAHNFFLADRNHILLFDRFCSTTIRI